MKIIIDAMGGDFAPEAPVRGALLAREKYGADIILTGRTADILRELEQAAQFGRVCRRELLDEVVRLGLVVDLGADEATLRKACAALELQELKAWRGALEQKAAALFPPQAQLPAAKGGADKLDAAYLI